MDYLVTYDLDADIETIILDGKETRRIDAIYQQFRDLNFYHIAMTTWVFKSKASAEEIRESWFKTGFFIKDSRDNVRVVQVNLNNAAG